MLQTNVVLPLPSPSSSEGCSCISSKLLDRRHKGRQSNSRGGGFRGWVTSMPSPSATLNDTFDCPPSLPRVPGRAWLSLVLGLSALSFVPGRDPGREPPSEGRMLRAVRTASRSWLNSSSAAWRASESPNSVGATQPSQTPFQSNFAAARKIAQCFAFRARPAAFAQ